MDRSTDTRRQDRQTDSNSVWKGILGIREFAKKRCRIRNLTARSCEAGFTKFGHGMRNIDMRGMWDAGFFQKKSRNAGTGPPFQTLKRRQSYRQTDRQSEDIRRQIDRQTDRQSEDRQTSRQSIGHDEPVINCGEQKCLARGFGQLFLLKTPQIQVESKINF